MNISYGFELELSDVDKSIDIPDYLGRWEGPKVGKYYMGAELDIVNTLGNNKGLASDPLCLTCTVGGEINVSPSTTIKSQLDKINTIFQLFPDISSGHVNHFHVHTYFDELEDFELLKNLIYYTIENEKDLIQSTYLQNWDQFNYSNISDWGRLYLIQDGGRYLNPEIKVNLDKCKNRKDIIDILNLPGTYYESGKQFISGSIRTAVNFSNLINNKTLEFRCFRSTLDMYHVYCELKFITRFIEEGLKGVEGKSVKNILSENNYIFAPLTFDEEDQLGWEKTRYSKGRGDEYKYFFKDGQCLNNWMNNNSYSDLDNRFKNEAK